TLTSLVEASGPYQHAASVLAKAKLPPAAQAEWQNLVAVADAVCVAAPNLALTVDAVENRGFEYHTGITFSVFAKGSQRELGRGGRYRLNLSGNAVEAATGATLLVDTLLSVVSRPSAAKRLFVPTGTPRAIVGLWQDKGWIVVAELKSGGDQVAEAKRL